MQYNFDAEIATEDIMNTIEVPKDILNTIAAFVKYESPQDEILCKYLRCRLAGKCFILQIKFSIKNAAKVDASFKIESPNGRINIKKSLLSQRLIVCVDGGRVPLKNLSCCEESGGNCSVKKIDLRFRCGRMICHLQILEEKLRQLLGDAQKAALGGEKVKNIIGRYSVLLLCEIIKRKKILIEPDLRESYMIYSKCNPTLYRELRILLENRDIILNISADLFISSYDGVIRIYTDDDEGRREKDVYKNKMIGGGGIWLYLSGDNFDKCHNDDNVKRYLL